MKIRNGISTRIENKVKMRKKQRRKRGTRDRRRVNIKTL